MRIKTLQHLRLWSHLLLLVLIIQNNNLQVIFSIHRLGYKMSKNSEEMSIKSLQSPNCCLQIAYFVGPTVQNPNMFNLQFL